MEYSPIRQNKDSPPKQRPKSAFAMLQNRSNTQLKQFSVGVLNQISKQLRPNHQENDRPQLHDDQQPKSSKMKWRAPKITMKQIMLQKKALKKQKMNPRNISRLSFQTQLQKLELEKPHPNRQRLMSSVKFPSQKTLLSKQKVVQVVPKQKQKYVIEICRLFKQNCTTIYQENTKQHEAFKQMQVKKVKNIQQHQKSKIPPSFAFNYDGSIMEINPIKKTINQVIQCVAQPLNDIAIKPLNNNYASEKTVKGRKKERIKDNSASNYDQFQSFDSQYIDNFDRIKWNPNIIVQRNKKFRKQNQVTSSKTQKQENSKIRNRSATLSTAKQILDDKSVIKIVNNRAYQQHLMIGSDQKTKKTSLGPNTFTSTQVDDHRSKSQCKSGLKSVNQSRVVDTMAGNKHKISVKTGLRCLSAHVKGSSSHQPIQIQHINNKNNQESKQNIFLFNQQSVFKPPIEGRQKFVRFEVQKQGKQLKKHRIVRPFHNRS